MKTLKTNFSRGHLTPPVVAIVDPGSIYGLLLKIFSEKSSFHIDGRPGFARPFFGDSSAVEIAAIDPDFWSRPQPLVPDGICWSVPQHNPALKMAQCEKQGVPTTV